MNIPEKSSSDNGRNKSKSKNKGALALAFGVGVLTGAAGSELASLIITKDYCCVGQSLASCKCRYECRKGETDRGDC